MQAAAAEYARAHDYDLVLHYNDGFEEPQIWTSANVMRKMQAGATIPLYTAPGVDVSKELLALLEEKSRQL